jgi:glycosidase
MSFAATLLGQPRPGSVRSVPFPHRQPYYPSPVDWRNEVLYFLLPDRFSDGDEATRPLLNRANLPAARPPGFRFDQWTQSGGERWQGGTLAGVTSKLNYLQDLGVTTLWVGPVFKQRGHLNTYHGYAIQDFLEVDAHFGTRQDLVDLVGAAHQRQIRVILDIIFNHSGHNWDYTGGQVDPPYRPWPSFYPKGDWIDATGQRVSAIGGNDDGVWPTELQPDANYTRAGKGSLGGEAIDDDHAEFKRTDFDGSFRDFNFDGSDTLTDLSSCYKYWIALTDCDGFRLDTLKHVPLEVARNFCGTIKEFAANLGKQNFFLVGEVGGPEANADRYLDVLALNLSATLDIGELRPTLTAVAKGLQAPRDYFDMVDQWEPQLGSHRNSGPRHVLILDDHDHVSGEKVRFSSDAASDHQVVAGVGIQLFTLGIPCLYYGTEQAFAGPEQSERDQYLPDYHHGQDKFLRENLFGGDHPRQDGRAGLPAAGAGGIDNGLPAFGAFGTVGHHCFDPNAPAFVRIRHLTPVRSRFPVLRYGRQYLRDSRNFGLPFGPAGAGEIIAWSRILDDEEALCVVNGHGTADRGSDVIVDASLNGGANAALTVIANSAEAAALAAGVPYTGAHPIGERLPVRVANGTHFVEVRQMAPSEVLVLSNRP